MPTPASTSHSSQEFHTLQRDVGMTPEKAPQTSLGEREKDAGDSPRPVSHQERVRGDIIEDLHRAGDFGGGRIRVKVQALGETAKEVIRSHDAPGEDSAIQVAKDLQVAGDLVQAGGVEDPDVPKGFPEVLELGHIPGGNPPLKRSHELPVEAGEERPREVAAALEKRLIRGFQPPPVPQILEHFGKRLGGPKDHFGPEQDQMMQGPLAFPLRRASLLKDRPADALGEFTMNQLENRMQIDRCLRIELHGSSPSQNHETQTGEQRLELSPIAPSCSSPELYGRIV